MRRKWKYGFFTNIGLQEKNTEQYWIVRKNCEQHSQWKNILTLELQLRTWLVQGLIYICTKNPNLVQLSFLISDIWYICTILYQWPGRIRFEKWHFYYSIIASIEGLMIWFCDSYLAGVSEWECCLCWYSDWTGPDLRGQRAPSVLRLGGFSMGRRRGVTPVGGVVCCGVVWCDLLWCVVVCFFVMCYDVVFCGVVWFAVVWWSVVWCGVVWWSVVWCAVVWWSVVWFAVVLCDVVWCGGVWCGVVWWSVMWCAVGLYCLLYFILLLISISQHQHLLTNKTLKSAQQNTAFQAEILCTTLSILTGNMKIKNNQFAYNPVLIFFTDCKIFLWFC